MTDVPGLLVRLYLDVNVHPWFAVDLTKRGFDAMHALELGHDRLPDDAHLRWATRDARTLFSFDRGDFHRLAGEWVARGEQHAGILLSKAPPRVSAATVHRRLLAFLDHVTADEMLNEVRWLDDTWS